MRFFTPRRQPYKDLGIEEALRIRPLRERNRVTNRLLSRVVARLCFMRPHESRKVTAACLDEIARRLAAGYAVRLDGVGTLRLTVTDCDPKSRPLHANTRGYELRGQFRPSTTLREWTHRNIRQERERNAV